VRGARGSRIGGWDSGIEGGGWGSEGGSDGWGRGEGGGGEGRERGRQIFNAACSNFIINDYLNVKCLEKVL
jgi:hypothetical protein